MNNPIDLKNIEFFLAKVYLKDASLEVPCAPFIFEWPTEPKVSLDFNINASQISADNYHSVALKLSINVSVVSPEQKTEVAYLVELEQCGIFIIKNTTPQQLEYVYHSMATAALFPYACEAANNLISKAGFPSLDLPWFNFEEAYLQQKSSQSQNS